MKKIWTAFLLFALTACSSQAETLDGAYVLQEAPAGGKFTLVLENGRYFGKSGVNNYFGSYTTQGNQIHFETGGATMMMGPKNLMEAERTYLDTLFKITNYQLEDKKLILNVENSDDTAALVFKKQ